MTETEIAAEAAVQRYMHDEDAPKTDGWESVRTFRDLQTTGLLWLINSAVLHPRGFALAMVPGDDDPNGEGPYYGWNLLGDGAEPWSMPGDEKDDALFRAVEDFLAAHRKDAP